MADLHSNAPRSPLTLFHSSGRLEAFSDGVFAIAITLLVLEIRVPSFHDATSGAQLWRALLERWPSYFAFLLSFFTIAIAWIGHHLMLQRVKTVTMSLVWTNIFFLLFITFLPFPTALVAEHLTHPGAAVACAVYAASNAVNSMLYLALYQVTNQEVDEHLKAARLNAVGGIIVCLSCIGLAFWSPVFSLLLIAALWIWWALPQRNDGKRGSSPLPAQPD